MLIKGKTGKPSDSSVPVNEIFLSCLQESIVDLRSKKGSPSTSYSPSGLACIRAMYYKRRGEVTCPDPQSYTDVEMAETGTRRHECIQEALQHMNDQHVRFLYIDVAEYVEEQQKRGRCLQLVVTGKSGAETCLWDKDRDIRFRVDGIIYDKYSRSFYLFEFKNQISYVASGKKHTDVKHHLQVYCYCYELNLDKAFVVYENRDTCELYLPEVFEVTEFNKQRVLQKIDTCEDMAKHGILPDKPSDVSSTDCRWCNYRKLCRKDEHV